MEHDIRLEGTKLEINDEIRKHYIDALRRIADTLEAKKDDEVAFCLGFSFKEDGDEESSQGVTAAWGPSDIVQQLARHALIETAPAPIREALRRAQKRVEELSAQADAANSGEGIPLPRGLNPEDADVSKLAN